MFRVKIKIPEKIIVNAIDVVKTGVRGVGYVKYDDAAQWPSWLTPLETPPTDNKAAVTESRQ